MTTPVNFDIKLYMQPSNSVYEKPRRSKNSRTAGSSQYSQFFGHSKITAALTLLQCSAITVNPDQSRQCRSQCPISRIMVDCHPFFAARCMFNRCHGDPPQHAEQQRNRSPGSDNLEATVFTEYSDLKSCSCVTAIVANWESL